MAMFLNVLTGGLGPVQLADEYIQTIVDNVFILELISLLLITLNIYAYQSYSLKLSATEVK